MIRAVKITVMRAEGYHHECGITHEFTGDDVWGQAHRKLQHMSFTAPGGPGQSDLGANKTDFTVTYADGSEYSGCLGLRYDAYWITRHMREFLEHVVEHREIYEQMGTPVDDAEQFLNTYEIGAAS